MIDVALRAHLINTRAVQWRRIWTHRPPATECAWCEKPALRQELDTAGRYVGACNAHRDFLEETRRLRSQHFEATHKRRADAFETVLKARDARARAHKVSKWK